MRKIVLFGILLILASCSTKKAVTEKPLYEVLTSQNDGGANIRFYEILTEPNEIKMLLGDPNLKKKIKKEDTDICNFVILNMGSQSPKTNNKIVVEKIEETADNIILTIKESKVTPNLNEDSEVVYPYSIVKINSKKPLIIK